MGCEKERVKECLQQVWDVQKYRSRGEVEGAMT